jgi:novobiocin biosynthesis protein NovU/D-mycarose 3-C-methyltransferase
MPDYALIFPWNYTKEILNKEKDFLESGGKFIIPCPEVKVISK